MRKRSFTAAVTIGLFMLLAQGTDAQSAEVKIIAGAAMSGVLGELGPQFERTTGHKLVIQYGASGGMKRQIESGEAFDLAIVPAPLLDDVTKQGKIVAATRTEIGRVGTGVGVRAGARKPDISSADALKRTLLNAKSISVVPEGESGVHLAKVSERLGIAEQMKAKIKPQKVPARVAQAVADGEAELGIAATTVLLPVPGVELVGLFPPGFQHFFVLTAGVGAAAKQPDAARALIKHLTAPAAVAVLKAKGMEPVAR